jgi:hypothetical protein
MGYKYLALDNTSGAIQFLVLRPAKRLDAPISGELPHISHESYRYTAVSNI